MFLVARLTGSEPLFHQPSPGGSHWGPISFTSPTSSNPGSPKPNLSATSVRLCVAFCTGFRAKPRLLSAGIPSCPIRRQAHLTLLATPRPCHPGSAKQISTCTPPSTSAQDFAVALTGTAISTATGNSSLLTVQPAFPSLPSFYGATRTLPCRERARAEGWNA